MENVDGIHLMSPVQGEYTICGDAFDGGSGIGESDLTEMHETEKTTVTCPKCVAVILGCRGVRIKQEKR